MKTKKAKKTKKTRETLEREIKELKAQLYSSAWFAKNEIDKFSKNRMCGGAVILELTALGGKATVPVAINGGLSENTINAIKEDLRGSQKELEDFKIKD